MLRWSLPAVWALGLVTCSPDELAPAELAELCGVEGPVRLLALEVDQAAHPEIQRIADRYYLSVKRLQRSKGQTKVVEEALWSVGTCGEAPRRIADDVSEVFTDPERWPGVLLGCRRAHDETVSFDLAGDEPPHVIFDHSICRAERTSHGFLGVVGPEEGPASLILYPYPVDPRRDVPEPRVLVGPEVTPMHPIVGDLNAHLAVREDTASVLTADGDLLTVALADGALTVEQPHVRNFYISPDGRYLLYQDLGLTQDDPYRPEGVVFLRDRTTGEGGTLAQDWLNYSGHSLEFAALGVVTLTLRDDVVRVFFLPGLDFVDLPQSVVLRRQLADGRWLMQAWWEGGPIYVGDLRDLEATTTLFGEAAILPTSTSRDGITVAAVGGCCHPVDHDDEGAMWFVPFDGSPPRRLAERTSRYSVQLDERRVATALDIDADFIADIALIDLETGVAQLIDRRVDLWYGILPTLGLVEDQLYSYQVVDGERSGVWLVRLPP